MHVGAFSFLCLSLTGCHCNMHHCPQSVGSVPSGIGGLDFNRLWLSRKIETNGYRHPTARSQCLTYLQMENSFNKSAPSILNTTTFCGGRFSQWCMDAPFKKWGMRASLPFWTDFRCHETPLPSTVFTINDGCMGCYLFCEQIRWSPPYHHFFPSQKKHFYGNKSKYFWLDFTFPRG